MSINTNYSTQNIVDIKKAHLNQLAMVKKALEEKLSVGGLSEEQKKFYISKLADIGKQMQENCIELNMNEVVCPEGINSLNSIQNEGLFLAAQKAKALNQTSYLETLFNEHQKLKLIAQKLDENTSAMDILHLFLLLPRATQNQICFYVWLANDAPYDPKRPDFGSSEIKNNAYCLASIKAPFISSKGKNLIEQAAQAKLEEYSIAKAKEFITQIIEFRDFMHLPTHTKKECLDFFAKMPSDLQSLITSKLAQAMGSSEDVAKATITNNPHQLNTSNILNPLIDQFNAERDTSITASNENKKSAFLQLLSNDEITSRQLRKVFKKLPPEVQAQVAKPPYFGHGVKSRLHETLGSHYDSWKDTTTFRVYAPNAKNVHVVLKAWGNDQHKLQMENKGQGVWEFKAQWTRPGTSYEYEIQTQAGNSIRKADPYAYSFIEYQNPDRHESMIVDINKHQWSQKDKEWMAKRVATSSQPQARTVLEVHPLSWKKYDGRVMTYEELGDENNPESLLTHCINNNFNAVELMGILEHPNSTSWGYQVTGFFAPTFRHGTPEQFQKMIDKFHQKGIAVYLDWVPAHFAIDAFGLTKFDGGHVYEHENKFLNEHPQWGTYCFNYESKQTRDFLISSLYSWLEKFHIDGMRVDAVTSMIYRNYGRKENEWVPHAKGKNVDNDALLFMKEMNTLVRKEFPGVLMMAEESSGFARTTKAPEDKGLGFHYKWAMGWENDTLKFFSQKPSDRSQEHDKIVHTVQNVEGDEQVVLPISHDEFANGKGDALKRTSSAEHKDRYRELTNLHAYQTFRPGLKLRFMDAVIAQNEEWSWRLNKSLGCNKEGKNVGVSKEIYEPHLSGVQWEALDSKKNPNAHLHRGVQSTVRVLNKFYRENSALWEKDESKDLKWIDAKDNVNNVISYHRTNKDGSQQIAVVHNFSQNAINGYELTLPVDYSPELKKLTGLAEVFNTEEAFNSQGARLARNNHPSILRNEFGQPRAIKFNLPASSTLAFKEYFS